MSGRRNSLDEEAHNAVAARRCLVLERLTPGGMTPWPLFTVVSGLQTQNGGILESMPAPLIEFPADDADRARRFWRGVLGAELAPRPTQAGSGWETDQDGLRLGIHKRGPGPGDTASLPYFTVADLAAAAERVLAHGGAVIHPGERWAVCRDSEGSPFALAAAPQDSRP